MRVHEASPFSISNPDVGGGQVLAFCGSLNISGLMLRWKTFEVMIKKYENQPQSCSPLKRPKLISYYSAIRRVPFAESDVADASLCQATKEGKT